MESLKLKKVIFYSDKIVILKKKGNIVIEIENIDYISFRRPTFLNCLLAYFHVFPNLLEIYLNSKINKSKVFYLKMKYNDIQKIQKFFKKEIQLK